MMTVGSRFNETRGVARWCPRTTTNRSDYLQIDLGSVGSVCAIATQGTMSPFYSTSYKLQSSVSGTTVFPGNTAQSGIVQNSLSIAIKARYVRFYPVTLHYWPCLRVEIFVQE
ncbi:neuropilin-2-like [Montipora foliosa]|uniref:neuropilin-2-like n=1 Tax=Montipora foliosa TaxID=591990 RepID=UPI0035F1A026